MVKSKTSSEIKTEIIDKVLSQKQENLEWQYSLDNSEIELIYWNTETEEAYDYFVAMDIEHFNKEVDYVHSEYYSDGFQQDIRTTDINIKDEDADFSKSDIIDCFMNMWHDNINNITIGKIDE